MRIAAIACLLLIAPPAFATGNAERGARFFSACLHCHSTVPGEHRVGPSLAAIFQREAGSVPGFGRYSDALRRSGKVWDAATLDRWLAAPEELVPGNNMAFPGVSNPQVRADLVAYLVAVSEGKAPPRLPGPAARVDLSKAPPEGQVRSITLCKGTYTVETADGHKEKVAESSLRFRTDSGELGPRPGKPVAIRAGGRAEGGSIIFASPGEMSRFIASSCD